ncbi:MAG: hypothetical protein ACO3NK_07985, partial [Prochlorotrichaceae cyanobacterium]
QEILPDTTGKFGFLPLVTILDNDRVYTSALPKIISCVTFLYIQKQSLTKQAFSEVAQKLSREVWHV